MHRDKFFPYCTNWYIGLNLYMPERKIPLNLNCGLDLIGEVLYGKWKIRLLWFIHQGHLRPSELQRKIPDASRRVLNMQLKELEDHELVTKKIYAQVPPKVEYSLTDFGKTLVPVIYALGFWGDEHENRLRRVILKRMEATQDLVTYAKDMSTL